METLAFEVALQAMDKYSGWGDIAKYINDEFTKRYGRTWHCIVGGFGFHVYNEGSYYIYFTIGEFDILLFKCG
jgi:hypothetical protein